MKFRENKFRIFWNIGTFGWKIGKKSDSKFEIWKILVQKHLQGEAFLSKKNYLGFSFLKCFIRDFQSKFYKGFSNKKFTRDLLIK